MSDALIPERTIDAWLAMSVAAFDPFARVWAPSPRRQARGHPWDWAIEATGAADKLIVLETKGLFDYRSTVHIPHVHVDLDQLAFLAACEVVASVPAFVGLPLLDIAELKAVKASDFLGLAALRLRPQFQSWLRVVSATSLAAYPPIASCIARGQRSHELATDGLRALVDWPDLIDFLASVRRCEAGRSLATDGSLPPLPASWLTAAGRRAVIEAARSSIRRDGLDVEVLGERVREAAPDANDTRARHATPRPLDQAHWIIMSAQLPREVT